MKKQVRRKLIIQQLMKKLDTYERRIRQMSENHFKIRQFIEQLNAQEATSALHSNEAEGSISGGSADRDAGELNVSDPAIVEAVLEEQPTELPINSGDIGINSGSTV